MSQIGYAAMEALILRLAVTTAIFLFTTGTVSAQMSWYERLKVVSHGYSQGRFQNKRLTEKQLKRVLNDHKVWYETYSGKYDTSQARLDPRRANLCKADLSHANLDGVNLSWALLSDANFSSANLDHANLSWALLWDADLSHVSLTNADLSHANLLGVNFSRASFFGANLSNALFEPKDLPDVDDISYAANLSQINYLMYPQALVKLRKAFKEGGYDHQEREVTYAMEHKATLGALNAQISVTSFIEGMFRYIFFDFTCQWGMVPGQALLILLYLIPVFTFPYMIALLLPGKNGIWRKWVDDRVRLDLGTKEPTRLHVGWFKALCLGLYFSMLSAFNIGWRELNVGNWIQRIQTKEYTLKASGWVRTVSGVQSLISAYLLALWALTYFGHPFE
jgi:uncharacterized protein YjbI with pentapeptide repeats